MEASKHPPQHTNQIHRYKRSMNINHTHSFKSGRSRRGGAPGSRSRLDLSQRREERFFAQQWALDDGDFKSRIQRLIQQRKAGLVQAQPHPRDLTVDGDVERNPGPPGEGKGKERDGSSGPSNKTHRKDKSGYEQADYRKSHSGMNGTISTLVDQAKDAMDKAASLESVIAGLRAQVAEAYLISDHYSTAFKALQVMVESDAQLDRVAEFVNQTVADEKTIDVPMEILAAVSKPKKEKLIKEEPKEEAAPAPDHHALIEKSLTPVRTAWFHTPTDASRWRRQTTLTLLMVAVIYWLYLMCLAPGPDANYDFQLWFVTLSIYNPFSYLARYVVHSVFFALVTSLLISLMGTTRQHKHEYSTTLLCGDKVVDLRSDAMSLGKLLHDRIYTATCTYRRLEVSAYDCYYDSLLAGFIGDVDIAAACSRKLTQWAAFTEDFKDHSLWDLPWILVPVLAVSSPVACLCMLFFATLKTFWLLKPLTSFLTWCARLSRGEVVALHRLKPAVKDMTVSLQLLSQLTTPNILKRGAKPEWVTRRIQETAQGCHSVAMDRFNEYGGHYVFQNTMNLAFAIWADMERESEMIPFPTSPVA